MGWYVIMNPSVITEESDTPIGQMCIDVFGSGWGSFKIAHMSTGDRIGIEIFEFQNNERPKDFLIRSNLPLMVRQAHHERKTKRIIGAKTRSP